VFGDFPTETDPRHADAYSPLWDAQLGLWTDKAVKQGLNTRQIDEVQVFNLAATRPDLLTGVNPATGQPAPYGSVGVDINCAVIGFIDKAPTANLAAPVPNSRPTKPPQGDEHEARIDHRRRTRRACSRSRQRLGRDPCARLLRDRGTAASSLGRSCRLRRRTSTCSKDTRPQHLLGRCTATGPLLTTRAVRGAVRLSLGVRAAPTGRRRSLSRHPLIASFRTSRARPTASLTPAARHEDRPRQRRERLLTQPPPTRGENVSTAIIRSPGREIDRTHSSVQFAVKHIVSTFRRDRRTTRRRGHRDDADRECLRRVGLDRRSASSASMSCGATISCCRRAPRADLADRRHPR
jgi:hypothetical protein